MPVAGRPAINLGGGMRDLTPWRRAHRRSSSWHRRGGRGETGAHITLEKISDPLGQLRRQAVSGDRRQRMALSGTDRRSREKLDVNGVCQQHAKGRRQADIGSDDVTEKSKQSLLIEWS
jgi:hypothetical protein